MWSGTFACTQAKCPCIAKASIKKSNQINSSTIVSVDLLNSNSHQKLDKNARITMPYREKYAQEIIADGLGNIFSKNIIHNSIIAEG